MPKLQNFTKPGHPGYIHRKRSVTQRWISKRERNKMKREGSSLEIKRENELKRQRETEKGRR